MPDEKRPSLREAARRGGAGQATGPTAGATPQRPKPPVVEAEQVAALCGHGVPFELFEDKKDKYRDAQRKKLADAPCPECRRQAHEERTAQEREAARKRRAESPPGPKKGRPPDRLPCRLPHGSRFDVLWDAAKGEWSGTLAVPGMAPFPASASGVFKLLRVLDGMYRAVLPAEAEAPEETAG